MKLLAIDSGLGSFLLSDGNYATIDKITKDDLLRLVGHSLNDTVEMDEYNETTLHNQAHRIIYKDIYIKLAELISRKDEYTDRSDRMFLDEYDLYSVDKNTTSDGNVS